MMSWLKFSHVVSFNSEDLPAFKAENLLIPDGTKKWKCGDLQNIPGQLVAVLQLQKSSKITQVDIGNENSAFVEVQVGKSANNTDSAFKTLLPAASFMSPVESKNGQVKNRVRMFSADKLSSEVASEEWDLVKVICTQPFNKHTKYGLSFITVSGGPKEVEENKVKLGAFSFKTENPDNEVKLPGSLYLAKKKEAKNPASSGMSLHDEMKSEETLASVAVAKIAKEQSQHVPKFQQKKQDDPKKGKKEDKPKKLPRRNVMPGEDPTPQKKTQTPKSREPSKKPSKRPLEDSGDGSSTSKKPKLENKRKSTKPFRKLFEGVIFTISGIQNPERSSIREKALEMGAKYLPDWNSTCTHLICAFANTPKFSLVKKEAGKIAKKDWIIKSHQDKKRYPWRRYCLDPKDSKKDESEDEIWDESLLPSTSNPQPERRVDPPPDQHEMDTDDEIEAVKREQADDAYEDDTEDEKSKKTDTEDSDEAYNADTDVDDDESVHPKSKTEHLAFPELPNLFEKKTFFLFGEFSASHRKLLQRLIIAGGGKISQYLQSNVNIVISNSKWQKDFQDALDKNPKLAILVPKFVTESFRKGKVDKNHQKTYRI